MNDTADRYQAAEEGAGENIIPLPYHDSSSPQATIIGWSSQASLVPVFHQDQDRAPSPMSTCIDIDLINQQPVAFARYSEDHPNHPYPSYNDNEEAPSALDQRSITPEAFEPPSHPYMASGYENHRPMLVQSWSGNRPSDYEVDEYSQDTLALYRRRTATFQAQAQAQEQPFSHAHKYELDSDSEHEPDLDLDLGCPFHDYSVKSSRARELFIAHVPVDMNEEELKELCSKYGDVISASIMYHGMGVSSRCFNAYAYVTFEQQGAADDALLKLNHHEVSMYQKLICT